MNFEKQMKKHINQTLDSYVPNPYPKKKIFPLWAKIATPIATVGLACGIAVPAILSGRLDNFISKLQSCFVDMTDVSAFALWNGQQSSKANKALMSNYHTVNGYQPQLRAPNREANEEEDDNFDPMDPSTWSDEEWEQYQWELDYDWDPINSNVLVSFDDEGKVKEVVYEMTNGKGIVKQAELGHAVAMYVSNNFTYVMYVDDAEYDFYVDCNFAQEMVSPTGFHCHHDKMQTIIIHNTTGKVFPLKELFPLIDEVSGVKNYTLQAFPTKDDYLYCEPLYGVPFLDVWYKVEYDEEKGIYFRFINLLDSYYSRVYSIRHDNYGQEFTFVEGNGETTYDEKEMASLVHYHKYGNMLCTTDANAFLYGTDGYMYAIKNNQLCVFGKNFKLNPVSKDTVVTFEGMENCCTWTVSCHGCPGISYHLEDGYLYSMFGHVWKLEDDSSLTYYKKLEGSFPDLANQGYVVGGEIIAYVDSHLHPVYEDEYVDGKIVQLKFGLKDGEPSCTSVFIIDANYINVSYTNRIIVEQDYADSYAGTRQADSHFFLIKVINGKAGAEYVAYYKAAGYHGSVRDERKITNPVIDPIDYSDF